MAGILVCELHGFEMATPEAPENDHIRRRIFSIDEDLLRKFDRDGKSCGLPPLPSPDVNDIMHSSLTRFACRRSAKIF